jgi:hypothetical protein
VKKKRDFTTYLLQDYACVATDMWFLRITNSGLVKPTQSNKHESQYRRGRVNKIFSIHDHRIMVCSRKVNSYDSYNS